LKRKCLAILLSLCLCLSLMPTALAAGTELKVTAPEKLPAVGETFTVTVDISGNVGFSALQMVLGFNADIVECVDVTTGDMLSNALEATNPTAADGAAVAVASARSIKKDGNVATYTFKVVSEGTPGIALDVEEFIDKDGNPLPYIIDEETSIKSESATSPITPPEEKPNVSPGLPDEKGYDAFTDTAGHRYETEIAEAVELGLFQGYADGSFGPERSVTRGAFVTVLWRMAGKPMPTQTTPFTDIGKVSTEFQLAIAWAYENSLINGRTATTFAPSDAVSRQAALKILFQYNGGVSNVNPMYLPLYQDGFVDCQGKADWIQNAMFWGYYNELIDSVTPSTLQPAAVATRAQLAKMFVSFTDAFGS